MPDSPENAPDDAPAEASPSWENASDPALLCLIVAARSDADRLTDELVRRGMGATRIGSTGGFLRRGSATLISGIRADQLDDLREAMRETCRARLEHVPVQTLPFMGEAALDAHAVEVRVGGAVLFVLPLTHFERF
jgi:uncharacterized protein YaaQ